MLLPLSNITLPYTISSLSEKLGIPQNQPLFVKDITFSSDIPFSKREFFYLTDLKSNSTITLDSLVIAYNQLKRKKRFSTIDISRNDKNIHFSLTANWIFRDVIIKGIWFGKHLYKNLYLHHPGDIFDISVHEESLETIKKNLADRGYFNASVIDEIIYNKKQKTIDASITIKKGSKAFIVDAAYTFNLSVPDALKKELDHLLNEQFIEQYFSKKHSDKAIVTIKTILLNHGYAKSTISLRFSKKKKALVSLTIAITLEEKLILHFKGNHFFSDADLRKNFVDLTKPQWLLDPSIIAEQILHGYYDQGFERAKVHYTKTANHSYTVSITEGIRTPPPPIVKDEKEDANELHEKQLTEQRLTILEQYQKEGYWYVDAQPDFHHSSSQVQWNIDPGEKVRFGKVILRGKTRLPFKSILKEIQFKEGEIWDKKKLDYSRQKLKELSIFKYISMHPSRISHKESIKPIILTVLDDNPFELKLRGGYFLTSKNFLLKEESTYKIGATVSVKNPLNIADKLSLITDFTKFERNVALDYQIPHLFYPSINFKFKGYDHKYIQPLHEGETKVAYEAKQTGVLTCFNKEFQPYSFWGVNVGNELIRITRVRGDIKLSPSMINKPIPYFFIEPNIIVDNLDDKIQTKRGSFLFSSIKVMVPELHRSSICKTMLDESLFFPLYEGRKGFLVLALRGRIGYIFREKFEEIMPTERFYLGGPNSVRGYTKDDVPPDEGGSSMVNGNVELRFPIYNALGGVTFFDIGALSQSGFSGFRNRWYPTSGFGLRYHTPIGALRFDIGWKWKKDCPDECSFAWYLTLGQCF